MRCRGREQAIVDRGFGSALRRLFDRLGALEVAKPPFYGRQPLFEYIKPVIHETLPVLRDRRTPYQVSFKSLRSDGTNLLMIQNSTNGVAATVSAPNRPSLKVSMLCGTIGMW